MGMCERAGLLQRWNIPVVPFTPKGRRESSARSSRIKEHTDEDTPDLSEVETGDVEERTSFNESCLICLEQFSSQEPVKLPECQHAYNSGCLEHWLEGSDC